MSIGWKGAAAALLLAAGASMAWAQMPGPGAGRGPGPGPGNGYGPGMMQGQGGHYGYGPWGGRNFRRFGKEFIGDRLDALRGVLKIADAQEGAWKTYTEAVATAQEGSWKAMGAMMQPRTMYNLSPEQRLSFMSRIIDLRRQGLEAEKKAAEALLPHLTEYQKGQASVLLPGLAHAGYGYGMGYGTIGGFGPGGYGMGYGMGPGYGMMGGYGDNGD